VLAADATETTCGCEEADADAAGLVVVYEEETLCSAIDSCGACSASPTCGWCSECGSCFVGTSAAPFFPGTCAVNEPLGDVWSYSLDGCTVSAENSEAPDSFDVSLSSPGIAFVSQHDHCSHATGDGCQMSESEALAFRVFLTKPAKAVVEAEISVEDFLNASATFGVEHRISGAGQFQIRQCEGPDACSASFGELTVHSLELPDWPNAATVEIKATNDSLAEGVKVDDENRIQQHLFRATFSSTDCAYNELVRTVPFDVVDLTHVGLAIDDTDGEIRVSEDCATPDEYTVALRSKPTSIVTVLISADPEYIGFGECGGGSDHLIEFSPANWDQPVAVGVWGKENHYDDGDELHTNITHTIVSQALGYREMAAVQQAVVLDDNDAAQLSILELPDSLIEATDTSFAMRLATQPRHSPVYVSVSFDYANDAHWRSADDLHDTVALQAAALCPVDLDSGACAAREYEGVGSVESLCVFGDGSQCGVTAAVQAMLTSTGRRPSAAEQLRITQPVLTFTDQTWDTLQNITIATLPDSLMEQDQDYSLQFHVSGVDAAYDSTVDTTRDFKVTDVNAQAVNLRGEHGELLHSSYEFIEDDGGAYYLSLAAEPSAGAAVLTIAAATSDIVVTNTAVLIPADRWDQPHRVGLEATPARMQTDDGDFYNSTVSHTTHGSLDGIHSPGVVSVTVEDDDVSGIILSCAAMDQDCLALQARRSASGVFTHSTGVPVLENRQTQLAVTLQSEPHSAVAVTVTLDLHADVVSEMASQRNESCRSLTDLASCLSVPHCVWEDPDAQAASSEEAAVEDIDAYNTCDFLVTHDACAIMLELNLYTVEQLEEEMGSDFCTSARECNYHTMVLTEEAETATCVLDNSANVGSLPTWLEDVYDAVAIDQAEPLIFDQSNWHDNSQMITVNVGNVYADTPFMVQYTVESVDGSYGADAGHSLEPGQLVLVNGDECGLNVTNAELFLSESDPSRQTYFVRLTSQPVDPQGFVVVQAEQKQVRHVFSSALSSAALQLILTNRLRTLFADRHIRTTGHVRRAIPPFRLRQLESPSGNGCPSV
jgi:hypothetical protein